VNDLDAFLESMLPRLEAADTALHNGDASARVALWSHDDPVTLFGAAVTTSGWDSIGVTFDWLASRFSNCTAFAYEVLAAGVSGDLAYIVGVEHTTASIGTDPPAAYALRVTTILRREAGEWRVVHRHGDPYDPWSADLISRLDAQARP
jgi:ketosteroid isomerase-like protein